MRHHFSGKKPGSGFFIAALLALLVLGPAGCSDSNDESPAETHDSSRGDNNLPTDNSATADPKKAEQGEKAVPAHLFFSPNGEPLNGGPLGWPSCGEAVRKWFAKTDANHDGQLSRDEFTADAKAQFAAMDIDHSGYLVPEELARYRAPFREGAAQYRSAAAKAAGKPEKGEGRGRKHGSDQADNSFSDIVGDPVMSADTNLDNRVTTAEFLDHAGRAFDLLTSAAAAKDKNTEAVTLPTALLGLCK